jgi:hypothetical protein
MDRVRGVQASIILWLPSKDENYRRLLLPARAADAQPQLAELQLISQVRWAQRWLRAIQLSPQHHQYEVNFLEMQDQPPRR